MNQRKLGIIQPKDLFQTLGIKRGNYADRLSSPQARVGQPGRVHLGLGEDEFGNPTYSRPGRARVPMGTRGIRGGVRGISAAGREARLEAQRRIYEQEQRIAEQEAGLGQLRGELEEYQQSQAPVVEQQTLPEVPGGEEPEQIFADPGDII